MSQRNRKHRVSEKKLVDVVIVSGGRWDFLKQCLEALENQDFPVNIIVIDNASPAEERIENQELFENVTTKRLQQHLGYSAANNEGVRMGSAPLVLLLNDDCMVTKDTISQMVKTMDDPSIGICGAKLLFPLTSTSPIRPAGKVQHIGISLNIRGEVFHPLNGWSATHPMTCKSRDTMAVTGACLMIRRDLFSKAGGLDIVYGAGTYEDVDLCMKARAIGKRVFVNTDAIAYHYVGATAEKKNIPYPMQANSMIFRLRWQGSPLLAWDEYTYYINEQI